MQLSFPQPTHDTHVCSSGDVTVHPTAAIAPEVLLQADPDSQIVIGAGVAIATGTVIHAHGGRLEIEAGACLGNCVLLIGSGKIGANACVGSRATIFNHSIDVNQIVPAGTVLGDTSRQSTDWQEIATLPVDPSNQPQNSATVEAGLAQTGFVPIVQPQNPPPSSAATTEKLTGSHNSLSESIADATGATVPVASARPKVYGLDSFNDMMNSLFPHRKTLHEPLSSETPGFPALEGKSKNSPQLE